MKSILRLGEIALRAVVVSLRDELMKKDALLFALQRILF